jgi:YD repeat-containing protein
MIVSGRTKYDAFGRVVEAYYPVVEDKSEMTRFNASFDSQTPTRNVYDVLNRITRTTLPDGTKSDMAYEIDTIKNLNYLKTTVTDALNNSQITFSNGDGKTMRTVQRPGSAAINTDFGYDAIDRLVTVTDTKGKQTLSVYDQLGRRTQVTHPASGITNFEYDIAGNLTGKQTANMIASGKKIRYYYRFNRLDSIVYPDHTENNVKYVYGTTDDNSGFNLKGRLKSLEDGSGKQEFKYGLQGDVTEVKRTLVIPNQAVATYTTKTSYDSWNRIMSMTYPDGEVVNYSTFASSITPLA